MLLGVVMVSDEAERRCGIPQAVPLDFVGQCAANPINDDSPRFQFTVRTAIKETFKIPPHTGSSEGPGLLNLVHSRLRIFWFMTG